MYRSATTPASTHSGNALAGDPRLRADLDTEGTAALDADTPDRWRAFWPKWPLEHLANGKGGRTMFQLTGDRFEPTFTVPDELGPNFDAMAAERVEWRLAEYLLGKRPTGSGEIRCKVSHSSGSPIIRFDRAKSPDLPEGETTFFANGDEYVGQFVKIALNTATRPGEKGNVLHSLLRGPLMMGKLKFATPKEAWGGEALDFTPALAHRLDYLGSVCGLGSLETVGIKPPSGTRRIDGNCKRLTQ